jgi:hypothetical protein
MPPLGFGRYRPSASALRHPFAVQYLARTRFTPLFAERLRGPAVSCSVEDLRNPKTALNEIRRSGLLAENGRCGKG